MLNVVRRGSTSIAKSFIAAPLNYSKCINIDISRSASRAALCGFSIPISRNLHTSSLWRQRSALNARSQENEDEGNEEDSIQDVISQTPSPARNYGPVTKFAELDERNMVCKTVVQTITKDLGLETMTHVQSLTINETLKGTDVVAQARTGTGKTLAFLVPVLQNIISDDPSLERRGSRRVRPTTTDIRAIIISPTRELAEQIAAEARKVARNTDVIVQTAVGGTGKNFHLQKMRREGCHILVGTPGRLNDILSDDLSGVRAPKLSAFVLDEADRLLDQGFRPEIENIQNILPNRNDVDRQTLLFSATVPEEVMSIVRRTAKPDFKFLRTVKEGEQQTHEKVPQKIVNVGGFENIMPALVELCKREIARTDGMPFKAIVYFAATAEVSLAAATFQNLRQPGQSVFSEHPLHPAKTIQIHGKLTQFERTRAAEAFRRATSAILLSSDVTARGMDFPNVTHVIQIGVPVNRDTYIHRIGRTARGDKQGEGWLLATNLELREARYRLKNLPLVADTSLETPKIDMTKDAQLPESTAKTLTQVVEASRMVGPEVKAAAYLASLGIYGWFDDKRTLIDAMNTRSKYCWGLPVPPAISPNLSRKLGLSQIPGINIAPLRLDEGFSRRPPIGGGYGSRGQDSTQFGGSDRGGSYGSRGSRPGGDFRDRGGFGRDRGSYGQDRGGYGRDRDSGYSGRGRSEGGDREPSFKRSQTFNFGDE